MFCESSRLVGITWSHDRLCDADEVSTSSEEVSGCVLLTWAAVWRLICYVCKAYSVAQLAQEQDLGDIGLSTLFTNDTIQVMY